LQRAFEVGDFQMDVSDADAGIHRRGRRFRFHDFTVAQLEKFASVGVKKAVHPLK
jgi:hypothetical protein